METDREYVRGHHAPLLKYITLIISPSMRIQCKRTNRASPCLELKNVHLGPLSGFTRSTASQPAVKAKTDPKPMSLASDEDKAGSSITSNGTSDPVVRPRIDAGYLKC